jgi:DNA-binding response OmpR family regulator
MPDAVVRLLHVEDELTQHRVLMARLRSASGLQFDPTWVTGEDEALSAYAPDRFDLVVMDYMLKQGNGLHLLQELRSKDPVIPVVAISGVAPSAVALELIQAGADDYFDKSNLDTRQLVKSIREMLHRTANLKHRAATPVDLESEVRACCQLFGGRLGAEFAEQLDRIESLARQAGIEANDIEELLSRFAVGWTADAGTALARPVILELGARLCRLAPENGPFVATDAP